MLKAVSSQWEQTNEIKSTPTMESPLKEIRTRPHTTINKYKESVCNGKIGKFKDFKMKLHINKQVKPVTQPERLSLSH